MDWTKTKYSYEVTVNVIHQTNVDIMLGSLSGVQLDNLSISEDYYSDSRIQAKVTTVTETGKSDGYVENARLRIILAIPEQNWAQELITGYVSDLDETYESGTIVRTYTIESTIWGLMDHLLADPVIISSNANLIDIWTGLLKSQTKMQYSVSNAQNRTFTQTILYEPGTDLATLLFEISSGYDRINVDGHGRITLEKYTAPSKRSSECVIDYNDVHNLVKAPLTKASTAYEAPGRVVVTATISYMNDNGENDQEVIAGHYDSPASHPTSLASRGYLRAISESDNGLSDYPTKDELSAYAKLIWEDEQDSGIEWSAETIYGGYYAGQIATLILPSSLDGEMISKKVLISSVSTEFNNFIQRLTMKEV